jgi:hypothetical protein
MLSFAGGDMGYKLVVDVEVLVPEVRRRIQLVCDILSLSPCVCVCELRRCTMSSDAVTH